MRETWEKWIDEIILVSAWHMRVCVCVCVCICGAVWWWWYQPEELCIAGVATFSPFQPTLSTLNERPQHSVCAPAAPFHVCSQKAEGLLAALVGIEVATGADHP